MKKISKNNIGNAGEYYFASLLSAKDFVTTITLGRAEKYDILAVSPQNKVYKFSVKTAYKNVKSFPLSEKDERGGGEDFFYVFVRMNELLTTPDYWVVPSFRVNVVLKQSHDIWKATLSKDGREHGESNIRNFFIEFSKVRKKYYPTVTDDEIKSYYKNLSLLK
jgi:hypothetical protein